MKSQSNRNRAAWLFVISLVVLCGSLTLLQYRWTGDVARAEMTLMRESLTTHAQKLCESFDAEVMRSRAALVPTSDEFEGRARADVYSEKIHRWKADKRLPLFKRVAVYSEKEDELFEMDAASESLVPMEWPDEWSDLYEDLVSKRFGRPPPLGAGLIRKFTVMDPRGRGDHPQHGEWIKDRVESPRRERESVIMELDTTYLEEVWLPAMVAKYLNPNGDLLYDVVVRSKFPPNEMVFSSGPDSLDKKQKALAIDFNYFGSDPARNWGAPPLPRWIMEVGYRAGSLEAVVAKTRRWNLAIAVALNGLILTSGWMLVRATRRSRRLAEERMRFVANVTHELRTPLTVIRGAAHNLKRGIVKNPEAVEKYSELIMKHAESLGAMVDQVLDLSGGRRGKAVRVPMNLWQVLQDTVQSVKVDPKFSTCRIETRFPAEIPEVTGDSAALRRAFLNLIENAAKHGGPVGIIEVAAKMEDHQVDIMITDHGPGIPEAELDDIFKPFFRGDHARTKQVRGSGLGLSLVKGIIEAHGGSISVSSELGTGSTFTVTLPT